jgi:transposase
MTLLPPNVKVHLAFGYTDMRKGIDGLAMLVQGVLRQDPLLGSPVRVPGPQGQPHQDRILGWDWTLPVHQAPRAGRVSNGHPMSSQAGRCR